MERAFGFVSLLIWVAILAGILFITVRTLSQSFPQSGTENSTSTILAPIDAAKGAKAAIEGQNKQVQQELQSQ